jgi:hypothetical protein
MNSAAPATYSANLPWIESPFFADELQKANLDAESERMIRQYAEQGFLIFDPQIDEAVIDAAREQAMPLYAQSPTPTRLQDGWRTVAPIQQIAAAPRVLELLRLMYRREPIPFQTLNFSVGTQQKTHSDSIHFNSIPQRFMCGVWVALEDVRDDNGPLHYYPASHKLPFYDLIDMGLKGTIAKSVEETYGKIYKHYEDFIQAMIAAQGLQKAVLNMKKGQAILWAANLLHGGEPIKTADSTRHSQVTHYYFDDCIYYTPLLSDSAPDKLYIRQITNIATGQHVANKYFSEALTQAHEGYSTRINTPALLLKISKLIPTSLRATLKKTLRR